MDFAPKPAYGIQDLVEIVGVLRGPKGCPWDREQTHRSIRKNLIEETYEAADAIDRDDGALLCEELGDILLQVALHAKIAEEAGEFSFNDVCDGVCKKLILRHPHVFGDLRQDVSSDWVLRNWEALKNAEKGRETAADRLGSVPATLPALMYAQKVQKRAADLGFGCQDAAGALDALTLAVAKLGQDTDASAGRPAAFRQDAAGIAGVLLCAADVARLAGLDAEEVLAAGSREFAGQVLRAERLEAARCNTDSE